MDNQLHAKYWRRFYWSEFAVQLLMAFAIIQVISRGYHGLSWTLAWASFLVTRLLFHWLVLCPRCRRRFFRALYMLDGRHKCQHCGLKHGPST